MNPVVEKYKGYAKRALSNLKNSRAFALTADGEIELAFIFYSFAEANGASVEKFSQWLESNRQKFPQLFQARPDITPLILPTDKLTGKPIDNPYSTNDHAAIAALEKSNSRLTTALKRRKDGISCAVLEQEARELADAKFVCEMRYGPEEHGQNPWVQKSGGGIKAIQESNPVLADFLKAESKPITSLNPFAPTAGSQNLTAQGKMIREEPEHATALKRAGELHQKALEAARFEAQEKARQAQLEIANAEARLNIRTAKI